MSAKRADRGGQSGMTLVEVLVSIAVLAILAGAIGAVFSVGVGALAPGGPQDRTAGARDFSTLEKLLGQDGARSSCIQISGGAVYGRNTALTPATCSSASGYGKVTQCASAVLCLAWPDITDTSVTPARPSCHVAVYNLSAATNQLVTRGEYIVPLDSGAMSATPIALTSDKASLAPQAPSLSSTTSYPWIRALPIQITSTQVRSGQPTATLSLHPVNTDPGGSAAQVAVNTATGAGESPC